MLQRPVAPVIVEGAVALDPTTPGRHRGRPRRRDDGGQGHPRSAAEGRGDEPDRAEVRGAMIDVAAEGTRADRREG